jgi:hypothetical protein
MRRKVIVGLTLLALASAGYVGYLLLRDPRQYLLAADERAVVTLGEGDRMLLGDASSEDTVPMLDSGDEVKIVANPPGEASNRMRKVSVVVESGASKGLTGTVTRIWLRPTSLLRGRGDF